MMIYRNCGWSKLEYPLSSLSRYIFPLEPTILRPSTIDESNSNEGYDWPFWNAAFFTWQLSRQNAAVTTEVCSGIFFVSQEIYCATAVPTVKWRICVNSLSVQGWVLVQDVSVKFQVSTSHLTDSIIYSFKILVNEKNILTWKFGYI